MNQPFLFESRNLQYADFLSYPDVQIESGKTTFLLGKSGSGKTTLFRLMNRTLSPSSGSLLYRGKPVDSYQPLALRKEVLLASQDVFLFDDSIQNNFFRFFSYAGLSLPSETTLQKFLETCALSFSLGQSVRSFSGGERQRLYLCIHLSMARKVLLLDEPTAALDPVTSRQVLEGIVGDCRQRGIDLIIISHNHELAEEYAEQTISLD